MNNFKASKNDHKEIPSKLNGIKKAQVELSHSCKNFFHEIIKNLPSKNVLFVSNHQVKIGDSNVVPFGILYLINIAEVRTLVIPAPLLYELSPQSGGYWYVKSSIFFP